MFLGQYFLQFTNPASDFEYDLNEDDTGVIIKKYKGEAKDVVIPSVIEDFPVVKLGIEAFFSAGVVSVVIPNGVKVIGESAFSYCTSLTSVTIGDGVQTINYEAFRDCTSLVSVTIGKGIKTVEGGVFRNCSSLTTFNIGVEKITYDSYYYDRKDVIKEYLLPAIKRKFTWKNEGTAD